MINLIDQQLKEIEVRNLILDLTSKIDADWKGAVERYDQSLGVVDTIIIGLPKDEYSPFERPVERIAEINLSTNKVKLRRNFLKERGKLEEFILQLEKKLYSKKIVREFTVTI
jgi:hypothetical protein